MEMQLFLQKEMYDHALLLFSAGKQADLTILHLSEKYKLLAFNALFSFSFVVKSVEDDLYESSGQRLLSGSEYVK